MNHCLTACVIIMLAASASAAGQIAGMKPAQCPAPQDLPERPQLDETLQPGAVYISGDSVESIAGGITRLRGKAEVARDQRQARGDVADYNKAAGSVDLQGAVDYWDDHLYLHAEAAQLKLDEKSASLSGARYRVLSNRGHGKADELYVISDSISEGRNINYTTCDPQVGPSGPTAPAWELDAEKITLDHDSKWGIGRNVVLKIKDIPVLYTPYISFPLSNDRKTGFLTPSFGNSRRNGIELETPFYWNIAPDMDATLTPRVMADSGVMLMGEYRYLLERGQGWIKAEYLPSDSNFHNQDRGYFSLEHEQSFAHNGNLHVLFNQLSDKSYLEDFGPTLELTSLSSVDRYAVVSFAGDNWTALARIQDIQTTNRQNPYALEPYKRLPQIRFDYDSPAITNAFNYSLGSELVYFDRRKQDFVCPGDVCVQQLPLPFAPGNFSPALLPVSKVQGLRFDLNPWLSYPVRNLASFIEPKVGLHYTAYDLENTGSQNDTPDRLLPYASLDAGLYLERDVHLFNLNQTQTLEPRIYYLYVPKENQNNLPIFDTGLYDDSFDSLFYENRYTGIDRINDANRVTLSLTSRLIDSDGREQGHVSVGQLYYFEPQRITLPGQVIQDQDLSPLVFELGGNLSRELSLVADWQWEPGSNRLQKLDLQARYWSETGKVLNVAYQVRQAIAGAIRTDAIDIEQTDVSLRWPIAGQWNLVGRWIYALGEHKSLDIFGGIEYDSCCWGLRLVGRRFVSNIEGDVQTGVFLQFQLKGLAGIGQKAVDFLYQNIPGYRNEF